MRSSLSYRVNKGSFGVRERAANASSHIAKMQPFGHWLDEINCVNIGDGQTEDSCINLAFCVDAFALQCTKQSLVLCWFRKLYTVGYCAAFAVLFVFCFCVLIISRLWFIPAQTGVYYYNDQFFLWFFFFLSALFVSSKWLQKPHI